MEIGINLYPKWPYEEVIAAFVENGISRTFVNIEHPEFERAMEELEKMLIYLENYKGFTGISHSSLLVNKIKIGQSNIAKSSEETLGHAYLRYLNNNDNVFASIKNDPRYTSIIERLAAF